MIKNIFFGLVLVIAITTVLAACGSSPKETVTPEVTPTPEVTSSNFDEEKARGNLAKLGLDDREIQAVIETMKAASSSKDLDSYKYQLGETNYVDLNPSVQIEDSNAGIKTVNLIDYLGLNNGHAYARCSTNETKQDIDRQRRELRKLGVSDNAIYWEYESGSKTERLQLIRLLSSVKLGDTIAATEVSRLTRSTKQLCEIIELAKEKKLELIIGTFRVDCRHELDPMTQGMIMMWGVFAEMERAIISQRVKSGMDNARAKGAKIGRPATVIDNLPTLFLKHYPKYIAKQITQEELARLCGLTRQSVSKYIRIYKRGTRAH